MAKKKRALTLSPQQKKFIWEYVNGQHAGNKARSYGKAYNNTNMNSCSASALKLLKKPHAKKYLAQVEQEARDEIFSLVRVRVKQAIDTAIQVTNDPDHKQFSAVMAQLVKLMQIGAASAESKAPDVELTIKFED